MFGKGLQKTLLLVYSIFFFFGTAQAQFQNPVKWHVTAVPLDNDQYEIRIQAKIEKGFSIYSNDLSEDLGPIPTSINIEDSKGFQKVGKIEQVGKKLEGFDPIWEADVAKFKNEVTFVQKVKLLEDKVSVKGSYEAQACNESMCFPPDGDAFVMNLEKRKPATPTATASGIATSFDSSDADDGFMKMEAGVVQAESQQVKGQDSYKSDVAFNWDHADNSCVQDTDEKQGGLWLIFTLGFLGGLIALLTPCVFPMIPLTVSYFTKGGKDRKQGVKQAGLYGISIIIIYVALGLLITLTFGADALNVMSTSAFFNILFFVIFVLFALSFFGLFEITLPSSWANKTDKLSNKGGFIGIFFMAFTLALVSFSCTGPIIGSLLVQAATDVGPSVGIFKIKPIVGMLGFSMALALPFTLFALFPQGLKELPKSGGWLEKVKVILGLLELAFAFKFLSIVDLTRGWGIIRWEVFMGIWIVIFLITGLYALGLFSKEKMPKAIQLFGILSLIFTSYMILYTVKYQSIPLLSGIAPSTHYNFFNQKVQDVSDTKDFSEALAMAKKEGKPILIDFSGYGCVNCRKMEEHVWVKDDIKPLLKEYIVTSLFVDDRTPLSNDEQYTSSASGKVKEIKTIGNKWTDFEIRHFQKASQPTYVLVDENLNVLTTPVGYSDAATFKNFLQCGLSQYKKLTESNSSTKGQALTSALKP